MAKKKSGYAMRLAAAAAAAARRRAVDRRRALIIPNYRRLPNRSAIRRGTKRKYYKKSVSWKDLRG